MKLSIVDFVTRVTTEGGPECEAAERIATFDNDGTLWIEHRSTPSSSSPWTGEGEIEQHPEWKNKEPFKSVLAGDLNAVAAMGEKGMLEIVAATHSGMTTVEFNERSRSGSRPPSIRASSCRTPNWSISRCWSCSLIFAPTASRPSSCPAAGSSSCAHSPTRSTASHPSRSSAPRASPSFRCGMPVRAHQAAQGAVRR